MLNFVCVYDVPKQEIIVFRPDRKLEHYRERVELFMASALKSIPGSTGRALRFFENSEIGFCIKQDKLAVAVIAAPPTNDPQKRILVEFVNLFGSRITPPNRFSTSTDADIFLKMHYNEYTKRLNLAQLFPEKAPPSNAKIEQEVIDWFEMSNGNSSEVISMSKEKKDSGSKLVFFAGFLMATILLLFLGGGWAILHRVGRR